MGGTLRLYTSGPEGAPLRPSISICGPSREEDDYRRKDVLHWIRVRAMPIDMQPTIVKMLIDDNSLDNEDDKKFHMAYHQVADCFFIGLTNNTGDPVEFWRPFRASAGKFFPPF